MEDSSRYIWKVLSGIVIAFAVLLIFFGDFLREIGIHRAVFTVGVYFGPPVILYGLIKTLNVKE